MYKVLYRTHVIWFRVVLKHYSLKNTFSKTLLKIWKLLQGTIFQKNHYPKTLAREIDIAKKKKPFKIK